MINEIKISAGFRQGLLYNKLLIYKNNNLRSWACAENDNSDDVVNECDSKINLISIYTRLSVSGLVQI